MIMNNKINNSYIIQKVTFPLVLLFGLQLLTGIFLTIFFYKGSFHHEIKSLGIVILLVVVTWYIWLIPFYTILWVGYGIYKFKKLNPGYFILFSLLFYLLYFTLVYRDNFWQMSCFSMDCSLPEWFAGERMDLFFNEFTLLINIYYCIRLFKNDIKISSI
jgi:hypothetical protein